MGVSRLSKSDIEEKKRALLAEMEALNKEEEEEVVVSGGVSLGEIEMLFQSHNKGMLAEFDVAYGKLKTNMIVSLASMVIIVLVLLAAMLA